MTEWQEDLIAAEAAVTLDGLFRLRVKRSPERTAYTFYDKNTRQWTEYSWNDIARQVERWRRTFASEGFNDGDRVAIRLRNGVEWVAFDQAAMSERLVTVPLYTEDRPDNVAYIIAAAAVKLLFVLNLAQWRKLAPGLAECDSLQRVLLLESPSPDELELLDDKRVLSVDVWLQSASRQVCEVYNSDSHALASIVYTSGTTGRSKGVMLSHWNMLSVAHAAAASVDCYEQDLFLSFLPLSHTLERTAGYYLPMMSGSSVAYARSINQLAEDLQILRPTVLIAVPRIFERVHGRIYEQLEKSSLLTRILFQATVNFGWRRFKHRQGHAGWRPELLFYPLLEKLVARKVTAKLGGRLRYAISGGAALPLPVARTFIGMGMDILQGYGLTETSPVICVNRTENNDPASVGEPLRGIKVRIGKSDELLVQSPGIMLGYWNNHAATSEIIDSEGWLHTGDQARIEGGRVYITGRIKDILVLSNGEKIPPGDMESAICLHPLFEQALVVGEGKSYLAALVVFDADGWINMTKKLGLDPAAQTSLSDERLQKKMLMVIKGKLNAFPGYAKIRRVKLYLEPWTVEDGLITPTLKLKRAKIIARYMSDIEAMYAN
jgi:long-chain acyl-CoA synthetase